MPLFTTKLNQAVQYASCPVWSSGFESGKSTKRKNGKAEASNNGFRSVFTLEQCASQTISPNRFLRKEGFPHIKSFRQKWKDKAKLPVWLANEEICVAVDGVANVETDYRISVIIVNFNCGKLLVECVQSVLASNMPVDVIVCDNCSTDSSVAALTSTFGAKPNLTIIQNSRNLGFARGCNLGLARSKGRYALFLNPDCRVYADTLLRMLAVMDDQPNAAMAGCLIRNPDGTEQRGCRRRIPTPWSSLIYATQLFRLFSVNDRFKSFNLTGSSIPENPTEVEAISGAFMLLRMEAIDTVGCLDEGYFLHCEDLDWCMRFQQAGYKILFVPDVEIIHAKGASSKNCRIRVEWHKHRSMIRFYKKHFRRPYSLPLVGLITGGVWLRFAIQSFILALRSVAVSERSG